jgi:NDP-sugar pyrophosphorylase family protein
MNIVIPMAGKGSRFGDGYDLPKPLIDVNGEPMIVRALNTLGLIGQYHFVIRKDQWTNQTKELIRGNCGAYEPKFIEIDYVTEGPASSVLLFENEISGGDELVVANCDQIMWWEPSIFLQNVRQPWLDGSVVTYWADTTKNSYAKLNRRGLVTEIKEKEVISNCSLNGIHYWKKGCYFINSAKAMIAANDRAPNGEFYVGPTYNYMIKDGFTVGVYQIPNELHHAVGTPEDLEKYITLEKESK